VLEDRAAHAAGTGDKNKVVGNHRAISFENDGKYLS
jgi:hypothetical protein